MGVIRVCCPYTLEPLKKTGLDSHETIKFALKRHAHSIQFAYKLVSTRRALEKSIDNSRHNSQDGGSARHPPDPHWILRSLIGEVDTRCLYPRCLPFFKFK